MLTVKIIWPSEFKNYNVYSATKYGVYELNDGTTQLLLTTNDPDFTDIRLSKGATVYVMNANGATIDTIRENRDNLTEPATISN